ncbi:uncharacterized protein [Drosophila takahashii]|uniref:uncharacterized protein n=1 Tax=Drosophila takahashii TaxID=29030 RepID=UPI001CF92A6E|nr:uncharacterized protein LOC108059859 [Drosophila takahashii]
MAAKKTTFDLMNLGYPVHADPYEVDNKSSSPTQRANSETVMSFKELKEKLHKEAKNIMPDFFPRDPSSSSDDSDDFDFPETLRERARRMSFARRRKMHYNEFATVQLARRLIHEEFNTSSESLHSEDNDYLAEIADEECAPCQGDSRESYPYIQYDRVTTHSQISDESLPKEDPEPGYHPTHHCYSKLINEMPVTQVPKESEPTHIPTPAATAVPVPPSPPQPEVIEVMVSEVETSNRGSEQKRTRVIDHGENIDLSAMSAAAKNNRSNAKRSAERRSRNL